MPKKRANGEGSIRKRKDGRWEGRYTAGCDPSTGKPIHKSVLAKTQAAYLELRRQFESHLDVRKTYIAVCHGSPRPAKGVVDQPVGRDRRRAVSRYEVLGRSGPLALVRFDIETGRLHQVRLHAKALGHPVVGDPEHGDAAADRRLRARPSRMMLHAVELSFLHPATRRRVTFVAPPPAALAAAALA